MFDSIAEEEHATTKVASQTCEKRFESMMMMMRPYILRVLILKSHHKKKRVMCLRSRQSLGFRLLL